MANDKFERIEKKFWMSEEQYRRMFEILQEHMEIDQYGKSRICNIYCDTNDYYLIRKSIEHPRFKEKLRIRSYASFEKDSEVFVEIKRKVAGVGYKRRVTIPFDQAKRLLAGQDVESPNPQIEREIHEFILRYHPLPKVFLSYDRIAMYGKEDPDLRITIDQNLRYRMYERNMDFREEGTPLIEDGTRALMEIKAAGCIPFWLVQALSELHIYQASFSKIDTCFTKFIAPVLSSGSGERIPHRAQYLSQKPQVAACIGIACKETASGYAEGFARA